MAVYIYSGTIGDSPPLDHFLERECQQHEGDVVYIPALDHGFEEEAMALFRLLGCARKSSLWKGMILDTRKPLLLEHHHMVEAAKLVYLGGGNTYFLMRHLLWSGLAELLTLRFLRGMPIAGHSAGAIVLTPSLHTAGFPAFDRDENLVKLRQKKGIGLVNFEFFPHYSNRPRYSKALRQYAKNSSRLLLAAPDSGGVVVYPETVTLVGEVWGFWQGQKVRLGPQWRLPG